MLRRVLVCFPIFLGFAVGPTRDFSAHRSHCAVIPAGTPESRPGRQVGPTRSARVPRRVIPAGTPESRPGMAGRPYARFLSSQVPLRGRLPRWERSHLRIHGHFRMIAPRLGVRGPAPPKRTTLDPSQEHPPPWPPASTSSSPRTTRAAPPSSACSTAGAQLASGRRSSRTSPPATSGPLRPAQLPAPLRRGGPGSAPPWRRSASASRRRCWAQEIFEQALGRRNPSARCASSCPAPRSRKTTSPPRWPACRGKSPARRPTAERSGRAQPAGPRRPRHGRPRPRSRMELAADEALRVLFVFAEARGSRPLGHAPGAAGAASGSLKRRSTRSAASSPTSSATASPASGWIAQIRDHGGYHVVHWSGHGHLNLLELAKPGGASDRISGEELLDLFTGRRRLSPAPVLPQRLPLRRHPARERLERLPRRRPGQGAGAPRRRPRRGPSRTSTRRTSPATPAPPTPCCKAACPPWSRCATPWATTMPASWRVEFYRALLADAQPKNAAAALTLARQRAARRQEARRRPGSRSATTPRPVLYGAEQPGLTLPGRSPRPRIRADPRLHQIAELTTAAHAHFVGRTWELAGLGADFIGSGAGAEVKPVAVITGLGGMGKTALAAEALALWETRFEWVLLYQAKPNPLAFDAMAARHPPEAHGRTGPLPRPRAGASRRCHLPRRGRRVHRPASGWSGSRSNLVRALQDEPILLVLDNFETNLKRQAGARCRRRPTRSGAARTRPGTSVLPAWPWTGRRALPGC